MRSRANSTPTPDRSSRLAVLLALCGVLSWSAVAQPQALPPIIDPTGRSGEPPFPEQEVPPRPEPPSPPVLPEPGAPGVEPERLPMVRATIKEIRITGSTVFTPDELAKVAQPYVDREITSEDLEDLRRALTRLYTEQGYINSGAFVPDQDLRDGVLEIVLVEGILSDIEIRGTQWFLPVYLRQRIELGAERPLNIDRLRERLRFLLQDNRITRLSSSLKPGLKVGESVLEVDVEEASPYQFFTEFNNYQSPTVGAERGLGTWIHQNLLGLGDVFRFTYGQSVGVDPLIDTSYALPFTPWDTTLILGFRKNDFTVVEAPFDVLDIDNVTNIYTATLRQPLYRTLGQEFAVSVTGEYLENKVTIFNGIPLGLVEGSQNGVANVFALRFGQEWLDRRPGQVFVFRSRFSLGIDAFDATINDSEQLPSGEFFAWLGQAQYAKRFDPWGMQLISRMDMQFAQDRLFPLEQFPVGGRFTVRGYRENTLVRDNAFVFSVEGRVPIWQSAAGDSFIQLAPFVDVGRSWETEIGTADPVTIASVGIGLRASAFQRMDFSVYWGQQLNVVPDIGDNIQDEGVHVNLVIRVL